MEDKTITAVGIDVSKGKSTVAVRRPGGEVVLPPFQVEHDAAGLSGLVKTLRGVGGDIRAVMEHTGMYWRPIALALKEAGFFVSVVNAMLIHDFRTCIHRRGMPDGRGILPSCKAKNRRNTGCISRFFNAAGRQKARPDGVQRL